MKHDNITKLCIAMENEHCKMQIVLKHGNGCMLYNNINTCKCNVVTCLYIYYAKTHHCLGN